MVYPGRYLFSATSFVVAVALVASFDYSDRGPHFEPPTAFAKTDRAGAYDLGKARILTKVVGHVRSHYVDATRVDPKKMAVSALKAVEGHVPEVMVQVERDMKGAPEAVAVRVGEAAKSFPLGKVGDLYELNWKLMDVFTFLERQLPPTSDLETVEYRAVNGLLSTLDPHSVLLEPRVYREMQVGTQGKFGGLGIVISHKDGALTVMSVMPQTPADRAGLKSGDKIVQIGEESTVNMPLNDAVNRLRGEPGTEVTVWVRREGQDEPKSYPMVREEIRIKSVDHHPLGQGIGYVHIRNFQGNTAKDLEAALGALTRDGRDPLKGLVIDLRENPGGLLDQAIAVSDRFLDQGVIVTTVREGSREREERHATQGGSLTDLPLIVLINRGSASASEIVAGALKNNDRALLVGSTSYGKGSVQVVYRLDEAALKLTVAQYLTPGEVSIQSVGVAPDIEVMGLSADKEKLDLRPDDSDERGEASLDRHLDSDKAKTERPSVTLRLMSEGLAEGMADDPTKDPLVGLAKEILEAAPAPKRSQALVQAAGFFAKRQAGEEQKLGLALAALGVDWQPGQELQNPKLEATLTLVGSADGTYRAGEELVLRGQVTNRGPKPVFRVLGVTRSTAGALAGRELLFGRIEPGASRTWETKVKLSKSTDTLGDVVKLDIYIGQAKLAALGEAPIRIRALPQPLFAHTVQVLDPTGNGDGLLQRGESAELLVRITNVGTGPAEDTLATIKNESGEDVYIEQGRERLGAIAAGASQVARFKVKLRDTTQARSVELRLSIVDQAMRTWTHSDLSLGILATDPQGPTKLKTAVKVGQAPAPIYGGAHLDASLLGRAAPGTVLSVVSATDHFYRIQLGKPQGATDEGWVARGVVTEVQEPISTVGVEIAPQHWPPEIRLAGPDSATLVTSEKGAKVAGTVRFAGDPGRGRRDVYIFRGEDKVFFRSATTSDADLGFETQVALEPGENPITIVARSGPTDVTRHSYTIYRK
jgi:carboxyl-terminal processing protease